MNKTYIKNTALLFAAMAVTKIVGAVFKIPLANILGGTGMGYFSSAYNLYSPVFALTAAGVPTVITRLTAKNFALGRKQNAVKIKKTALLMFSMLGAAGMLAIWLLSGYFARNIACSEESAAAISAIAPAVFFCCIGAVIRGYYEGRSNVVPTAAANITEAVSRAIIGLALSYGVIAYAKSCYYSGKEFLGICYDSYEQVYSAALPWAAAAAILAVTLSEAAGLISLLISDRKRSRTAFCDSIPTDRKRVIIPIIIKELMPIAAFALIMNCFSFVDLMTVTRTLDAAIKNNTEYFARLYPQVFGSGIQADALANFMYGSYTGIAMSLFMIIPSFAGMAEKTAVPEIAAAWERNDNALLCEKTTGLIRTSAVIGCPACFGALALAEPILAMLYPNRLPEASVCLESFIVLCGGGVLMIMASAFFGIFQAIGKGAIPLWIMTGVIGIKALLNLVLLNIPEINITGSALATVISYGAAAIISGIILKRLIRGLKILRTICLPLLCGALCAAAAYTVHCGISQCAGSVVSIAVSVLAGGFVYVLSLILTGVFRQVL